ncbi:hypothetical protein NLJ89_g10540 [Agrocybe chaxingu]|uniref:Uncharacterized protein n=1 Tax=Agrocybe chaxingu TaxID=84603 RepID=A0A9W8MQT8_9AGAR|nr:hypothetical protein NLJ89_g10540 [Agrocybe chaxingu]
MSKPLASSPAKTNPPPNFFSSYSVVLPVPISNAFDVLGRGDAYEPVARLSALCKMFELLGKDNVQLPVALYPDGIQLRDVALRLVEAESASDVPTQHPGAHEGPKITRQHFKLEESVPVLFGLFNNTVRLSGTISWDDSVFPASQTSSSSLNGAGNSETPEQVDVLYESVAETTGIAVWKLRTFERVVEAGEEKTRVSERIEGWAPAWMRWLVQQKATESHRAHMDLYHTLF